MAILVKNKFIFIHTPKTGGTFVYKYLQSLTDLNCIVINPKHSFLGLKRELYMQYIYDKIPCFTFVRNPIEWHRSYWASRMIGEWDLFESNAAWHPTWNIDSLCKSTDFNQYIENVNSNLPGYIGNLYDLYTKFSGFKQIDFIGKTENLENDLKYILNKLEIYYVDIHSSKINESNPSFKDLAKYSEKNLIELIKLEQRTMNEFGYSTNIEDYSNILSQ